MGFLLKKCSKLPFKPGSLEETGKDFDKLLTSIIFFDIENIPIKELFHFALVINGHSAEVYINAKLVKTQVLFGEARYNKGDLYLNFGGNLNGNMLDFKFIAHALNQKNILHQSNHRSEQQDMRGPY